MPEPITRSTGSCTGAGRNPSRADQEKCRHLAGDRTRGSEHNPERILLIATNPVDVLTGPSSRDRHSLSVDAGSVDGYITVLAHALANIAGMRLPEFRKTQGLAYDPRSVEEIFLQTRNAACRIIERKGATYLSRPYPPA